MKLKTNKAINKRMRITKGKKVKIRAGGQDHFNARESGKVRRNKRRNKNLSKANIKNIKKLIPYS
ncbi:50S ribosomal protein L35 [Patescibacteria group bacterium]|nr:50S ribosomal protein L35 [Patescibacteria group bacterium]